MENNKDYISEEERIRREIRNRNKRNAYLMKKRQKELRRLKVTLAAAAAIIACVVFGVVKLVSLKQAATAADEQLTAQLGSAESDIVMAMKPEVVKKVYEYPTISSDYKEITSEDVRVSNIAVMCVEDSSIVSGRLPDSKIFPASMTKVMTLLVAVDELVTEEELKSRYYTFEFDELNELYLEEATVAGYLVNESVSAYDMLYGLVLPSGADAAIGLAKIVAGSEQEFVKLMNEKCTELGLKNTHFENTSGLHDDNQYTTAIEMALIMRAAMDNPICANVLSTYQYTSTPTLQHPDGIPLTSTMFSRMYGNEAEGVLIEAGKTGYVYESGHCLVSYATKGDKHYICVMAKGVNKWHCIFDTFEVYENYT